MKKMLLLASLMWAFASVMAQYAPVAGVYYNIVQTNSSLVIGPAFSGGLPTTQPAVMTLTNTDDQAFEFIEVGIGVYNIKNKKGMYLGKSPLNNWTTVFQDTLNGSSTEWSIGGTDSTDVRLMLVLNSKYLASDKITSGSALYCDKSGVHANGMFKLTLASSAPVFKISDKNVTIELEEGLSRSYPLTLEAYNQTYDIHPIPSTGLSVSNTVLTPSDFINGSGKVKISISLSNTNPLAPGDTGKVVFSYTQGGPTVHIDSVMVTTVPVYQRSYISLKNTALVLGNQTTTLYPVLTEKSVGADSISQLFIFRPVNPGVNDSLFYIVQDGDYRMLQKVGSNNYDTEYGLASDEAKWKIDSLGGIGTIKISNFVTKKDLGTDADTINSRLYGDKIFMIDAIAKPFCEWIFSPVGNITGIPERSIVSKLVYVSVNNGNATIHGLTPGSVVKIFSLKGQLMKQFRAGSSIETITMKPGMYLIKTESKTLKVVF